MSNLTSSLTVKLIDDVSKPARSVATALEQAGKQAQAVAKAMAGAGATDRLGASLAKLKLGARDIETVGKAWREYAANAKLAANSADWTRQQAGEVRRWESQTIAALKAVEREQARFARASRQAMNHGPSQWGHGGAANFAAQGVAGAVSAHGVYHVTKSALEQGAEYQHERVALMNAGRSEDLKRMEEAAKLTAKALPTASYTETLKAINETTSSFGSIEHAIENIGFVMKTASVLKAAAGDKISEDAGAMGQQYAKFFEMRGTAGNPEKFREEGNEMTRAMVATRGTFNPREMFMFASQAKSALRNYDIDYLSKILPSIIGETTGERTGTGALAFANVVMGKARDQKQAAEWQKYGLLDPAMTDMKAGHAVSWRAGAVKGTDLAMANPLRWMEEVVLPAMKAKGVNVDDKGELTKVLATMFRNQMSNQFANENAQLADRTRLHKDAAIYNKTDTPDEIYKRNLGQDPSVAIDALTESLKNLGAAASAPAMAPAAATISGIAVGLQALAAAAKDHPIAAMTAGGVAATGAMAGAGYITYQALNGFGLKEASVSLNTAAGALLEAAALQRGEGVAGLGAGGAGGRAAGSAGRILKSIPLVATAMITAEEAWRAQQAYNAAHPATFDAHKQAVTEGLDRLRTNSNGAGGPSIMDVLKRVGEFIIPAAHAEGMPQPRASGAGLETLTPIAKEAGAAVQALDTTVAPKVDTASLQAALAHVEALLAGLRAIGAAASSAGAAAARLQIPSLGAAQRGHFTFGGTQGE